MRKYSQWIGTTIIALIAIAVSAPPILSSWPRWVILGVGILLLVGVALTFPYQTAREERASRSHRVNQSQKAGNNSRLVQGRDITITGGIGDREQK